MSESLKREIKMLLGMSSSELAAAGNTEEGRQIENVGQAIATRQEVTAILERPFRELLLSNGYDPDEDFIFFSKESAENLGVTDQAIPGSMKMRVRILDHLDGDNVFMLRSTEELRRLPRPGRDTKIIIPDRK